MEESSRRAVEELSVLLWGHRTNEDVFKRWRQGFILSADEKSALLQLDGGPCSVIASVQAFIIKNLFFNHSHLHKDQLSESDQKMLLLVSMCDILKQARNDNKHCVIAYLNNNNNNNSNASTSPLTSNAGESSKSTITDNNNKNDNNIINTFNDNNNNSNNNNNNDKNSEGAVSSVCMAIPDAPSTPLLQPPTHLLQPSLPSNTTSIDNDNNNNNNNSNNKNNNNNSINSNNIETSNNDFSKKNLSMQEFHRLISMHCHEGDEGLQGVVEDQIGTTSPFSCLLFLYSVLFTKGLESLRGEMSEANEPLIDPVHGHGTQSLTNLLLTGQAVSHVWDNFKELSGLRLTGISSQSNIGFLTLLEHLRYIEVGWYLKSPKYPIWLLASETHITVFFSQDMSLLEDNNATAKRVFNQHDKEARGFIASTDLNAVMHDLNLFSDPQYVDLMLTKLDPEQLGIVTMETFLHEFFPLSHTVKKVKVFHYNGLCRSCPQDKVRYVEGELRLSDSAELQMMADDTSAMRTCLMTRWPAVEVLWLGGVVPSLN